MKSQVSVINTKLEFATEKVANLSDAEMNNIIAGTESDDASGSTKHDFTCGWCTSTTSLED